LTDKLKNIYIENNHILISLGVISLFTNAYGHWMSRYSIVAILNKL